MGGFLLQYPFSFASFKDVYSNSFHCQSDLFCCCLYNLMFCCSKKLIFKVCHLCMVQMQFSFQIHNLVCLVAKFSNCCFWWSHVKIILWASALQVANGLLKIVMYLSVFCCLGDTHIRHLYWFFLAQMLNQLNLCFRRISHAEAWWAWSSVNGNYWSWRAWLLVPCNI